MAISVLNVRVNDTCMRPKSGCVLFDAGSENCYYIAVFRLGNSVLGRETG